MKCQLLQRLAVLNKYDKQRQPGEGVKPWCVVKHATKASPPACGDEVAFEEELLITWWRQAHQHQKTPTLHSYPLFTILPTGAKTPHFPSAPQALVRASSRNNGLDASFSKVSSLIWSEAVKRTKIKFLTAIFARKLRNARTWADLQARAQTGELLH